MTTQQQAEKYAADHCISCNHKGTYGPCICNRLESAFLAGHEASAPLPMELEEAAKEAAEHYIKDETLQFQTVCRQQGYSLDIIEEWAKVDYRKGFLAGSRYQSQASLPGDVVERLESINPKNGDGTDTKWYEYYGSQVSGKGKESYVHSAACYIACKMAEQELFDKLRELLSHHPATEQKQKSAGVWVKASRLNLLMTIFLPLNKSLVVV